MRARPPDFERFWAKTMAELGGVSADVVGRTAGGEGRLDLLDLEFSSLWGARIRGYLLRWDDDVPRPLVVHSHGYGARCEPEWAWAARGAHVLGVDIRGFGRSADAVPQRSPWGFMLTGREAPETHVLRGVVCDFVRAVEVGRRLVAGRVSRLVVHGTSFSGALGLMAEALLHSSDLLAVAVPTFGWTEARHFFVRAGSGNEVNEFLDSHPDEAEDLMLVLRYFDTMYFAGLVRCPTLIGVGIADDVVPSPTVYAIANHLSCAREVMEFPVSHSVLPEERLWDRFEDRWLQLALHGVPAGFGTGDAAPGLPARRRGVDGDVSR